MDFPHRSSLLREIYVIRSIKKVRKTVVYGKARLSIIDGAPLLVLCLSPQEVLSPCKQCYSDYAKVSELDRFYTQSHHFQYKVSHELRHQ